MFRGYCVQIHGVNNIGKTTQARQLIAWLERRGMPAVYVKFPYYDLLPQGPFIRRYIKDPAFRATYERDHPDAKREIAHRIIRNHHDFESELQHLLSRGIWVVMEDGIVTSMAWSKVYGLEWEEISNLHRGLYHGDYHVLLHEIYDQHFAAAEEVGHANEGNRALQKEAKEHMRMLMNSHVSNVAGAAIVKFEIRESIEMISQRIIAELRLEELDRFRVLQERPKAAPEIAQPLALHDYIVRVGECVYTIDEHGDVQRIKEDGSVVAVMRDQFPSAVRRRIATLLNLRVLRH